MVKDEHGTGTASADAIDLPERAPLAPDSTSLPYDSTADNIVSAAHWAVASNPDGVCLRFLNDRGAEARVVTRRQMWDRSGALASLLLSDAHRGGHGLEKGDRALLCYAPGPEFLCAFWACLRSGVVAVPCYPPHPKKMGPALRKLELLRSACGAKLCLLDKAVDKMRIGDKVLRRWPADVRWVVTEADEKQSSKELKLVEKNDASKSNAVDVDIHPSDLAFLQFTSGSTFDPKGVMVTHGALWANVNTAIAPHHFRVLRESGFDVRNERTVCVTWLPQYHDMGLVACLLTPFVVGVEVVMLSPLTFLKRPMLWMEAVSKYRAACTVSPNFGLGVVARRCGELAAGGELKLDRSKLDLSCLKYIDNGAERIQVETVKAFVDAFEPFGFAGAVVPCYGLAESVLKVGSHFGGFAASPRDGTRTGEPVATAEPPRDRFVSCVLLSSLDPSVDVRVVNPETLSENPDGIPGEVWVSSPSVAAGYWGLPELSESTFRARLASDGGILSGSERRTYLRTGDEAFVENGCLFIASRLKDLIIIGGKNYYPEDAEIVATKCSRGVVRPGCIAAFSMDSSGGGTVQESLAVVFEVRGKKTPGEIQEAVDLIQKSISSSLGVNPHRICAIKERTIPKTTSGKIRRRATKEALLDGSLATLYDTSIKAQLRGANRGNNKRSSLRQSVSDSIAELANNMQSARVSIRASLKVKMNPVDPTLIRLRDLASDFCRTDVPMDADLASYVDSISSIEFLRLVNDDFDTALEPSDLLECSTLKDLSKLIRQESRGSAESADDGQRLLWLRIFLYTLSYVFISTGSVALGYASFLLAFHVMKDYGWHSALVCVPVAFVCWILSLMALCVLTKWILIGRCRPGRHSVRSLFYWRWWTVERLLVFCHRCGVKHFVGSQLYTLWLVCLGADMALSAVVKTSNVSEMDLLHVGANAVVEEGSAIRGAEMKGEYLILDHVRVGRGASVGACAHVGPGCSVTSGESTRGGASAPKSYGGDGARAVEEGESELSPCAINRKKGGKMLAALKIAIALLFDLSIAVGAGFVLVAASIPAYLCFGELAERMDIFPDPDDRQLKYKVEGRDRKWQPLLEDDGNGYFSRQMHVTPHIGFTVQPLLFDEFGEVQAPSYDYREEALKVVEEMRLTANSPGRKSKIEFYDDKLLVALTIKDHMQWQFPDRYSFEDELLFIAGLDSSSHDAILQSWREKVRHDLVRPTTVIQRWGNDILHTYNGDRSSDSSQDIAARDFQAFVRVMPHSEFPSGSACICTGYADFTDAFTHEYFNDALQDIRYGPNASNVGCNESLGLPVARGCDYNIAIPNMTHLGKECGQSRLWGGMHFTESVTAAEGLCAGLGEAAFKFESKIRNGSSLGNKYLQGDARPVCPSVNPPTTGAYDIGCLYPLTMPDPITARKTLSHAISSIAMFRRVETPIVQRVAFAALGCETNCLASHDERVLNVLTMERPKIVTPSSGHHNGWSRMLCIAQCYGVILEPDGPDLLSRYWDEWGLNVTGIDPTVQSALIEAAAGNDLPLSDMLVTSNYDPLLMGQIIGLEIANRSLFDGWNANGFLTFDSETGQAVPCTANCQPYADVTGYFPENNPQKSKPRLSPDFDYKTSSEGYYLAAVLLTLPPFFLPFLTLFIDNGNLYDFIERIATAHYIVKLSIIFALAYQVFGMILCVAQVLVYVLLQSGRRLAQRSKSTIAMYFVSRAEFYLLDLCYRRFPYLLVGTESMNWLYAAMGTKVGKRCRIFLDGPLRDPAGSELGEDAVLARHAIVGTGWKVDGNDPRKEINIAPTPTQVGDGAVLAPCSSLERGAVVQDKATVAPLTPISSDPEATVVSNTVRVGGERPITLPLNPRDGHAPEHGESETEGDASGDWLMRLVLRPLHALLFPTALQFVLFTFGYPSLLLVAFFHDKLGLTAAIGLCGVGFTSYVALTILAGVLVKWVLIQRVRHAQQESLSSFFFLRYISSESCVDAGRFYCHALFIGTPVHNIFLRLLGADVDLLKTRLHTDQVYGYDNLRVKNATVCRDVVLDATGVLERKSGPHSVRFSDIQIEDNVTCGAGSVILGGAAVQTGATVGTSTLLLHDQVVGERSYVQGCLAVKLKKAPGENMAPRPPNGNLEDEAEKFVDQALELVAKNPDSVTNEGLTNNAHRSEQSTAKRVLLTGANGWLGVNIAQALLNRDKSCHVYAIVKQKEGMTGAERMRSAFRTCRMPELTEEEEKRLHVVEGELLHASSRLGLESEVYDELAAVCTHVLHCAADTRFNASYRQLASNATMTAILIKFALSHRRKIFVHISTAFVNTPDMADKDGTIYETTVLGDMTNTPFLGVSDWMGGYMRSKWVSEKMLVKLAALLKLPVTILRPGRVVGSQSSGYIADQHLLHILQDIRNRGEVPDIRGRLALTSVDHFARASAAILLLDEHPREPEGYVRAYNSISPRGKVTFRHLADMIEARCNVKVRTTPFQRWRRSIKEDPRNKLWYVVSTFTSDIDSLGAWLDCAQFFKTTDGIDPSINSECDVRDALWRTIGYMQERGVKEQRGSNPGLKLGNHQSCVQRRDTQTTSSYDSS